MVARTQPLELTSTLFTGILQHTDFRKNFADKRFNFDSVENFPNKRLAKECGRNKLTNWLRMVVGIQGAEAGA